MKPINTFIQYAFVFLIGLALGWFIKEKSVSTAFTLYLPALATLMAAYFGAKYAFDLHENREKEKSINANVINGNLAIYNLSQMVSNLICYQRQVIEPVRDSPTMFIEMRPTLNSLNSDISFNIEALSFLLGTSHRNLLGQLSVEESRYKTAIDAINERSRLHLDEVQPTLERAEVVHGGNYTLANIETALGNRLFVSLQQATTAVIKNVDPTILSLQEIGRNLRQALREIYPSETILGFTIANPQNEQPETP